MSQGLGYTSQPAGFNKGTGPLVSENSRPKQNVVLYDSPRHFVADVYFVHKDLSYWKGLDGAIDAGGAERELLRGRNGRDVWIITTYVWLKSRGLNVHLVEDFVPGAICVAHSDDIDVSSLPAKSFVVAVRADRERQFLCEVEIVQSPAAIESSNAFLLQN